MKLYIRSPVTGTGKSYIDMVSEILNGEDKRFNANQMYQIRESLEHQ